MRTLEEILKCPEVRVMETGPDGGNGIIKFGQLKGSVVWSFGGDWEHVSVAPFKSWYVPSWHEMCRIKDLFFYPDEVAVQYHPAESEYVNFLENCLHLWRPTAETLPVPPFWMVGPKTGKAER